MESLTFRQNRYPALFSGINSSLFAPLIAVVFTVMLFLPSNVFGNEPQIHHSAQKKSTHSLTTSQVQAINIINGEATECMMHAFFLDPSKTSKWRKINGMYGRQGIDGLYIKESNGVIKDVLVAESKWNTSRLKKTMKGTVQQMSRQWVLNALKKAKPNNPDIANFDQIIALAGKGIYRGRLFNLKPSGGKLRIVLWHIKNKGDDRSIEKIDKSEIVIDLNHPQNPFYARMVDAFNRCRRSAIKKAFPQFDEKDIQSLLRDDYIQKEDIARCLY